MIRRHRLALLAAVVLFAAAAPTAARLRGDNPVERALDQAVALYGDGQLVRSLSWLERARDLMEEEMALTGHGSVELPSNAAELLHYLDIYGAYAYGSDAADDAAYDFLVEQLSLVLALEADAAAVPGLQVGSWADGRVHRVGDVDISHWADGRIHRVGDYDIRYWSDGRPHDIGGIAYRYPAGSPWPREVGDVEVR